MVPSRVVSTQTRDSSIRRAGGILRLHSSIRHRAANILLRRSIRSRASNIPADRILGRSTPGRNTPDRSIRRGPIPDSRIQARRGGTLRRRVVRNRALRASA